MAVPIPNKLFKYQPYNSYTIDNLKNRVLWFSYPATFNDPFDISIIPTPDEPTEAEWGLLAKTSREQWLIVYPNRGDYWDELWITNGKPNHEFKQMIMNSANLASAYVQTGNRTHGVACFSAVMDDLLMWAHYADKHHGICLEFETRFAPFPHANAVAYADRIPTMNLVDSNLKLGFSNSPLLTTKSTHWAYEQEWRIFSEHGDFTSPYEPAALTAVYCGCTMPPEEVQSIANMLKGSPALVCEMQRSEVEFKVTPILSRFWMPPE